MLFCLGVIFVVLSRKRKVGAILCITLLVLYEIHV